MDGGMDGRTEGRRDGRARLNRGTDGRSMCGASPLPIRILLLLVRLLPRLLLLAVRLLLRVIAYIAWHDEFQQFVRLASSCITVQIPRLRVLQAILLWKG